jgi:heme-degrading monooxygenase HmoA
VTESDQPYVAVIFSSQSTGVDVAGYEETAVRMETLAATQPGYLGIESVRGADGFGITVSYWSTEDDARAWKRHSEHLLAQRAGRSTWYESYRVRIATVTRDYSYDAAHGTDDTPTDTPNR